MTRKRPNLPPSGIFAQDAGQSPYRGDMIELGSRTHRLPAPQHVVWESLTNPHKQGSKPWLRLLSDEVEPEILRAEEPTRLVWSSLWPSRPHDQVELELTSVGGETALKFTLLTSDEPPDPSKLGHLRKRLNHLLGADLRFSFGQ